MQTLLVCVLTTAVGLSANATEGEKKAWQWTDEERLMERFDPTSAQYRLEVAKTDVWQIRDAQPGEIIVDGDRNPELIMPHELMDAIRMGAFSDDPATRKKWRDQWVDGERVLGQHFWERFESVARSFVEADRNAAHFGAAARNAGEDERPALQAQAGAAHKEVCPARARALAAARELFGRETFDRFLYEIIAPGMQYRTSPTSQEAGLDLFMWVAGGCQ